MVFPFLLWIFFCPQKKIWCSSDMKWLIPIHYSLLIPRILMFKFDISLIRGPNIKNIFATLKFSFNSGHISRWKIFSALIQPHHKHQRLLIFVLYYFSSVAHVIPFNLADLFSSIVSALSWLWMSICFSLAEYWNGLTFSSPVDCI